MASFIGELERLEGIFAGWDEDRRGAVGAYRAALEGMQREALRRLIRSLRGNPSALAALKEAATDEVVYAALRHHGLLKPSVNERVEAALAAVRPALASHGGDVRLVAVAPPRVEVELIGVCGDCAASTVTLRAGVERAIRDACPEIAEVVETGRRAGQRKELTSPFATQSPG